MVDWQYSADTSYKILMSVEVYFSFMCLILRDLDPENPQHEQYVTGLVASLIQELEAKATTMTTEDLFLTKLKLIEAANMFRVSNARE